MPKHIAKSTSTPRALCSLRKEEFNSVQMWHVAITTIGMGKIGVKTTNFRSFTYE